MCHSKRKLSRLFCSFQVFDGIVDLNCYTSNIEVQVMHFKAYGLYLGFHWNCNYRKLKWNIIWEFTGSLIFLVSKAPALMFQAS